MNISFVMYLAQPSSLDMLVLVGKVRDVRPGVQPNENLLHEHVWCAWSLELTSLFGMWRTASSRSFDWCAARRRRLRAAGVSGAGRRAGLLLRAAWPSGRACDISASQLACT